MNRSETPPKGRKLRATIYYYLARPEARRTLLMVRVSCHGHRFACSVGIQCKPAEWHVEDKRFKRTAANATERNRHLANLEADLTALVENAPTIEAALAAAKLHLKGDERTAKAKPERRTLADYTRAYVQHLSKLGKAASTVAGFKSLLDELTAHWPHLLPANAGADFLSDYAAHCVESGNVETTVSKKVKRVKALLKWVSRTEPVPDDVEYFQVEDGEARAKEWLSFDELERVKAWHAAADKSSMKAKACALLLMGAYTGLRISDLVKVKTANIRPVKDADGVERQRLTLKAQKTGKTTEILLPSDALELLAAHGGAMPEMEAPRVNSYLIKLAAEIGIGKHVTTHVGRNTFASLLYLKGTPIERIGKALSHSSTEQTLLYVRSLDRLTDLDRLDVLNQSA